MLMGVKYISRTKCYILHEMLIFLGKIDSTRIKKAYHFKK